MSAWDYDATEKDARRASAMWGDVHPHPHDPTPTEIKILCFPYRMRKIAAGNRSPRGPRAVRVYRLPAGPAARGDERS